jgi:hypothetical protein
LEDIAVIKFVGLTRECDLFSDEFRKSAWKPPIDDAVEFVST